MRYKPKNTAALHIVLGGLPDKMRVEADKNLGVSAHTVGELQKVTAWSENLVITTPEERSPESAVKVSKASVATRTSPKAQVRRSATPRQGGCRANHMTRHLRQRALRVRNNLSDSY
jgi:hypothetical protein